MNHLLPHRQARVAELAASLALVPSAELFARIVALESDMECLYDCVAEDAAEAALFGDGPCGSYARAQALSEAEVERDALALALRPLGPVAPEVPVSEEDLPF